ncbi:MAG: dihydrodipicolinate synthase family protein [Nanoarchaeota archaeon]
MKYAELITPLCTPPSECSYRELIRHVYADGIGANIVFPMGTTGRFYNCDAQDVKRHNRLAIDAANKCPGLQVAAGITGRNLHETSKNLAQSVDMAVAAARDGADYVVLMPVYLNRKRNGRCTRRGTTAIVDEVVDALSDGTTLILYNNPHMTDGKNLQPAKVEQYCKHPAVAALKDSSGDSRLAREYADACHAHGKSFYVGDEVLGLQLGTCVHDGIVAGSSNVLPQAWRRAVCRGEQDEFGAYVAGRLIEIQRTYADMDFPAAFLYMLSRMNVVSAACDVPDEARETLDTLVMSDEFQKVCPQTL